MFEIKINNVKNSDIKRYQRKNTNTHHNFADILNTDNVLSEDISTKEIFNLQNTYISNYVSNEECDKYRANEILYCLKKIRDNIVLNDLSEKEYEELKNILNIARFNSSDNELNEILNDIELRAEVEIAKYQYATQKI